MYNGLALERRHDKQLSDANARVSELREDRLRAAAVLLLDFLDCDREIDPTPEQIAEIERRLKEDEIATDDEARDFFDRMKI